MSTTSQVSAREALLRLREGNQRFVSGESRIDVIQSRIKMKKLAETGQRPFAVVLSCSDSRAPSELLFDQDLGELFVIRVAGNYVAPSIVGSIEFAAATFGTELVVVMGHTNCGAIQVTLDTMLRGRSALSENVEDIISRIRPGLEDLAKMNLHEEEIRAKAISLNVRASIDQLKHGSEIIESLLERKRLWVVGAECELETGTVKFFATEELD